MPAQALPPPGSSLGTNALDFATANTPGPITGAVGASAISPNYLAAKDPSNTSAGLASTSLAGVTGATDLLGMGRAVHQIGAAMAVRNDATAGPLAHAEAGSSLKRGAADLGTNVVDATAQSGSMANSIMGAAAPVGLNLVGPVGGLVTNSVVGARSTYRAGRAAMHWSRAGAAASQVNAGLGQGAPPTPVGAAAIHVRNQMRARTARSTIGAIGAGLGIAGGALALASNPVGWALMAAGGAVAAGLGIYKLGRWAYKKFHQRNLGADRRTHATSLVHAARTPADPEHASARQVLAARGIDGAKLTRLNQAPRHEAIQHLERKLEAW